MNCLCGIFVVQIASYRPNLTLRCLGTAAAGARLRLPTWTPGRRLPPPPPPQKTATESEAEKKRDEDTPQYEGTGQSSGYHHRNFEIHVTYHEMSAGTRHSLPRLLLHSRLPVLRPPRLESRQQARIKGGKPTERNVRTKGAAAQVAPNGRGRVRPLAAACSRCTYPPSERPLDASVLFPPSLLPGQGRLRLRTRPHASRFAFKVAFIKGRLKLRRKPQ